MLFSRATASAICKSSSRLALTPDSGIVITPFNYIHLTSVSRTGGRRLAAGFDQCVGQDKLGIADIAKRQLDRHRFGARLLGWEGEADCIAIAAGNGAAKALAARQRPGELDLSLV